MAYASVLEAHIEVLQGLQKVSAYTEDMFNPDEIDLQLIRQQERLIEEIVNKRFEDMQVGLDFIRPLIVKNQKLQVFLPQFTEAVYEPFMVYAVLPSNYYHLVNNRSIVTTSTDPKFCADLTEYKAIPESSKEYIERVAVLGLPLPTNLTPPFYYNFSLTFNTTFGNIVIPTPVQLHNLKSKNSWFAIVNYFIDNFKQGGVQLYWEMYRDIYAPKSFIIVTADDRFTGVSLGWTTSPTDTNSAGSNDTVFVDKTFKIPNYTKENLPGFTQAQIANLLTETDEFYTQNLNVFYKTTKGNPKSQVSGDLLMAYEDKSFLISDLYADYVRKPKHISLSLNQNFELAGDGPRIVVDRTVEYLKLAIENPAYEAVTTDNKVHNQI